MNRSMKCLALFLAATMLTACAQKPQVESTPAPTQQPQEVQTTATPPPVATPATASQSPQAVEDTEPDYPLHDPALTVPQSEHWGHFPLWARIESENIYLYGINPSGYILYQDEIGTYFDWPGLSPRRILPQLNYADFDGDGENELAVALYISSGTGVALMELHIVKEIEGQNSWEREYADFALPGYGVDDWFTKPITAAQSDDRKTIQLSFDHADYTIYLGEGEADFGPFREIDFGDIIYFEFYGDRIKTKISLGLLFGNSAMPLYFADVQADVTFDGKSLALENYELKIYDEYSIEKQ